MCYMNTSTLKSMNHLAENKIKLNKNKRKKIDRNHMLHVWMKKSKTAWLTEINAILDFLRQFALGCIS